MKGLFLRAAETKEKVMLMYLDGNDQLSQRVVKILKMKGDNLLVYCYKRKTIRTLKLEQILSAEPIRTRMGA